MQRLLVPVLVQLARASISSVLVVYAYAETSITARDNLRFFLKHALLPPAEADFVFVLNGAHTLALGARGGETPEGAAIAARPNVAVVERANTCFDFGAWGVGVTHARGSWLAGDGKAAWPFYVLINSSVRGPFMPLPVASGSAWPAYFVNQLGGEHNVGLVGTSLNCWTATQETHLQSMFLATHRAGLEDVIERGELLRCMESHGDAVFGGEIPLSQAFIAANYSLRTQLRAFARTEPPGGIVTPAAAAATGAAGSRLVELCLSLLEDNAHSGDVLYPGEYGGLDVSPLETVFFKANRGVSEHALRKYTEWMGAPEPGEFLVPALSCAISDHG